MKKQVGEKLYLSLQLYNGIAGASNRVFCKLRNSAGVIIGSEFEVPHIASGFFSEAAKVMPLMDVVFAIFRVTEGDGTTPSDEHTDMAQRYDLDESGSSVAGDSIVVEVSSVNIIAEVSETDISVLVAD